MHIIGTIVQTGDHVDENRSGYKNLSVIVPVYNEKEVLAEFHKRLSSVLIPSFDFRSPLCQ